MQKIIGFTGFAGSGKTTAAQFAAIHIGGVLLSFAGPLREMLKCIGINMDQAYWRANKEAKIAGLGVSPRFMLQTLGTEWGRQMIHPDLWLMIAQDKAAAHNLFPAVFDDARFQNEADWVRENGILVHVRRRTAGLGSHISEKGIEPEPGDFFLDNNGSVEQLQAKVHEIFESA